MILALIPDAIKLPAAAVLGAALMLYPARWYGQYEGKQMAATAALSKSVQALRERNQIDDQVSTSDAAALCADLGLSDSGQAECVRRLESASSEDGNGDLHHQERQDACERDRKP